MQFPNEALLLSLEQFLTSGSIIASLNHWRRGGFLLFTNFSYGLISGAQIPMHSSVDVEFQKPAGGVHFKGSLDLLGGRKSMVAIANLHDGHSSRHHIANRIFIISNSLILSRVLLLKALSLWRHSHKEN